MYETEAWVQVVGIYSFKTRQQGLALTHKKLVQVWILSLVGFAGKEDWEGPSHLKSGEHCTGKDLLMDILLTAE